jgi:hypothetical protein
MKEYITSIRTKIQDRNFVASEYYKSKVALNEKKNKTIMQDPSTWLIPDEVCTQVNIDPNQAKTNPVIARKLLFSDETKKTRNYADYFAYMNYGVYREILKFEEYFAKSLSGNLKMFIEKNVENITNSHLAQAELLSDVIECFNFLTKN